MWILFAMLFGGLLAGGAAYNGISIITWQYWVFIAPVCIFIGIQAGILQGRK